MKTIYTVILFVLFFDLGAQDYQVIPIQINLGATIGVDIIEVEDGFIINSLVGQCEINPWGCTAIVKTDFEGEIEWTIDITDYYELGQFIGLIAQHPNGEFIAIGSGQYSIGEDYDFDNFAIRFNLEGELLQEVFYVDPLYDSFASTFSSSLFRIEDGYYWYKGLCTLNQEEGFCDIGSSQRFLVKLNDTLGIEWEQEFMWEVPHGGDGEMIQLLNNNLVYSKRYRTNDQPGVSITYADSVGNTIWRKNLVNAGEIGSLQNDNPRLTPLVGGSVAYTWGREAFTAPTNSVRHVAIRGMDENGNQLWETLLGSPYQQDVSNLTTATNGDILGCGYDHVTEEDDDYYRAGRIFRMTPAGEVLWHRKYYIASDIPNAGNFLSEVIELENGGLAAIGSMRDTLDNGNSRLHTWLLLLDGNGCLEEDCGEEIALSVKDIISLGSREIKHFELAPNPTYGNLKLQFNTPTRSLTQIRMVDVSGKTIHLQGLERGTNELSIDLSDYISGMYFLMYEAEGRILQTEKVLKL